MCRINRKADLIAILYESDDLIVWHSLTRKIVFRSEPCDDDKICFIKYLWGPSELYDSTAKDLLIVVRASGSIQISYDSSHLQTFCCLPTTGHVIMADVSKTHLFLVDSVCPLHVISLVTRDIVGSFSESELLINEPTSTHTGISSISCHYRRNDIVISCKNRTIRVLRYYPSSGILSTKLKFMDPVNKWSWKFGGQSHHLEFDSSVTFGVALTKGRHTVYMWENGSGSLLRCLDGPKEEVNLALWHPMKPQLITIGSSTGQLYIWGPDFQQKWSALVPNIEAIETNIEYIEREEEFDLPGVSDEKKKDENLEEIFFESFRKKSESVLELELELEEGNYNFLHSDEEEDDKNLFYPLDIQ